MTVDAGLALGMAAAALLAIGAPLLLLVLLMRRGASFRSWLVGAGTFFVAEVMLRLPWQIPLGSYLKPTLEADAGAMWGWMLLSSLSAALFEELGRYVAFRRFQREHTRLAGVMMGAGHAAIESIGLVGLALVANLVSYLMLGAGETSNFTDSQVTQLHEQFSKMSGLTALLGGVERLAAIVLHVGCSLLVMKAFSNTVRRPTVFSRWVWVSVGLHSLANLLWASLQREVGPLAAMLSLATIASVTVWLAVRDDGVGRLKPA